jgi:hypothetical protein
MLPPQLYRLTGETDLNYSYAYTVISSIKQWDLNQQESFTLPGPFSEIARNTDECML